MKRKIILPEGFEVDHNKTTSTEIVLKRVDKCKELPKSWEGLGEIEGAVVSSDSRLRSYGKQHFSNDYKRIFPSRETANAGGILLPQLLQLRDIYRDGWKPDWTDNDERKYVIMISENKIYTGLLYTSNKIFAFRNKKTTELFLKNFKPMLEECFNALTE